MIQIESLNNNFRKNKSMQIFEKRIAAVSINFNLHFGLDWTFVTQCHAMYFFTAHDNNGPRLENSGGNCREHRYYEDGVGN